MTQHEPSTPVCQVCGAVATVLRQLDHEELFTVAWPSGPTVHTDVTAHEVDGFAFVCGAHQAEGGAV